MAKSRFEYVRNYELPDPLLPGTFIVVRIDGRGFHKFSDTHAFEKPNDKRALDLMDRAARTVMQEYRDVILAFGESDEYSFLLKKNTKLYNRRRSKISSSIVSLFTSSYVFHWPSYFPDNPLKYPPSFDSRAVMYPGEREVRDYFAWRQADTHINNLYNTAFWALVKDGQSTAEANKTLQGTDSKDKNELLFSNFGINYNNLPEQYRKGSICVRRPVLSADADTSSQQVAGSSSKQRQDASRAIEGVSYLSMKDTSSSTTTDGTEEAVDQASADTTNGLLGKQKKVKKPKPYEGIDGEIVVVYEDIIRDDFWKERPWLLQ
ncbi:hypothetical protein I302_102751 [Kwoniella bestiolae CBS 10118]|uniref:tRNA(His) guanylyltransferase n=1 Tax=Kwoniella bestiolae CBS 10118 TaxID=1296100 RepID=A0A1B9GG40_9TREE|nr:tRNA(His) guanylyltransferase [Kwoniella bestiolae CBS 10118]OCF29931.1 tRNA(His) guanylyltransferase [Kwoniella bestiolae CBS 10118]